MTPPKKRGATIAPEQLEELEATALANLVQKIAAGGIPTTRERSLLRQAAELGAGGAGAEPDQGGALLAPDGDREAQGEMVGRALAVLEQRWQKEHVAFTNARHVKFLAALELTGEFQAAADIVGINVRTARTHRTNDKAFREDCEIAIARHNATVTAEYRRRAIEGVLRPVYQGGALVGYVREFSDRLLENYAKARMPEFRDKVGVEHSGTVATGVLVIPPLPPLQLGDGALDVEARTDDDGAIDS